MEITITMTATDVQVALDALYAMADNEHDKGADEGCGSDFIAQAIDNLRNQEAHRSPGSPLVTLHHSAFAIMCDAVDTYCSEPDPELPEAAARAALAERLAKLPDVALGDAFTNHVLTCLAEYRREAEEHEDAPFDATSAEKRFTDFVLFYTLKSYEAAKRAN